MFPSNKSDRDPRIDNYATLGLEGVHDSLAYRVHEIERHIHGRERWWGAVAVPDETNAIDSNVDNPFVAASGNNTWGAAIPVIGSADVPVPANRAVRFDVHRIMFVDVDGDPSPWKVRLIYGTGTSGDAIAAGQYSEAMFGVLASLEVAIEIMMPRVLVGTKVWAQVWNDTNAVEADFFIGVHGYEG